MSAMLAFLLLVQPTAPVNGLDYVYVYGNPNRSYQCDNYLVYLETEGYSSMTSVGCVLTGIDSQWWPVFPPMPISIYLDDVLEPSPLQTVCQFVAYANPISPSTSTVIDCRASKLRGRF